MLLEFFMQSVNSLIKIHFKRINELYEVLRPLWSL